MIDRRCLVPFIFSTSTDEQIIKVNVTHLLLATDGSKTLLKIIVKDHVSLNTKGTAIKAVSSTLVS